MKNIKSGISRRFWLLMLIAFVPGPIIYTFLQVQHQSNRLSSESTALVNKATLDIEKQLFSIDQRATESFLNSGLRDAAEDLNADALESLIDPLRNFFEFIEIYDFEGDLLVNHGELQFTPLDNKERTSKIANIDNQIYYIHRFEFKDGVHDKSPYMVVAKRLELFPPSDDATVFITSGKTVLAAAGQEAGDYKKLSKSLRAQSSTPGVAAKTKKVQNRDISVGVYTTSPVHFIDDNALFLGFCFVLLFLTTFLLVRNTTKNLLLPLGGFVDTLEKIFKSGNYRDHRLKKSSVREISLIADAFNFVLDHTHEQIQTNESQATKFNTELTKTKQLIAIDDVTFDILSEKMDQFRQEYNESLSKMEQNSDQQTRANEISKIFRSVHTLKSNARLFGMETIHNKANTFEDFLGVLRQSNRQLTDQDVKEITNGLEGVLAEFNNLCLMRQKITGRRIYDANMTTVSDIQIQWLKSLVSRLMSILGNPNPNIQAVRNIKREFRHSVATVGNKDIMDYIKRYDTMVEELGKRFGKEMNPIAFEGNYRYFNKHILSKVNDILIHCIRNAIDHGIEASVKRKSIGKPRAGTITIRSESDNKTIKIRLSDDGRGIDAEKLADKARAKGFITPEERENLNAAELMDLIFTPGISTATHVTDVSGRGVGMDVVREFAQEMGGDASIESQLGVGTSVVIEVPVVDSRFLLRKRIFDLQTVFSQIALDISPSFKRASVTLDYQKAAGRFLVRADRTLFARGFRRFMFYLGGITPDNARIKLSLSSDVQDDETIFKLKIDSNKKFSQQSLDISKDEILQSFVNNVTTDQSTDIFLSGSSIELGFKSALPKYYCENKFFVLALCEESEDVRHYVNNYLSKALGGWSHQFYGPEEKNQFLADAKSEQKIVIINASCNETMEWIATNTEKHEDINYVFVADDVAMLTSSWLSKTDDDPLIVERPLSSVGVEQAIETTILKSLSYYNHVAPNVKKEAA